MKKTNNDSITNQTSLYQFSILSSFLSFRKKKNSRKDSKSSSIKFTEQRHLRIDNNSGSNRFCHRDAYSS